MKCPLFTTFLPQSLISLLVGVIIIILFADMHNDAITISMRNSLEGSMKYAEERIAGPFDVQRREAKLIAESVRLRNASVYRGDGVAIWPDPSNLIALKDHLLDQMSVMELGNGTYSYVYQQYRIGRFPGVASTRTDIDAFAWGWSGATLLPGPVSYFFHNTNISSCAVWSQNIPYPGYVLSDLWYNNQCQTAGTEFVENGKKLHISNSTDGAFTALAAWVDLTTQLQDSLETQLTILYSFSYPLSFDPATGFVTNMINLDMDCKTWLIKFVRELDIPATSVTIIEPERNLIMTTSFPTLAPGFEKPNASDANTWKMWSAFSTPEPRLTSALRKIEAASGPLGQIPQTTQIFESKDEDDIVSVRPVRRTYLNLIIVGVTDRGYYFDSGSTAQRNAIIVCAVLLAVGLAVAAITAILLAKPLKDLGERMQHTASLKDDSDDSPPSMVKEIAEMQEAYDTMKWELFRLKSFLPQGIMEDSVVNPLEGANDSFGSEEVMRSVTTLDLAGSTNNFVGGVNSERLGMATNEYTARDCVVVVITTAYSEKPGTGTFAALVEEFFRVVVRAAGRNRGVIEVLKPHQVIISFGARKKFSNPASAAYRLASTLTAANLPEAVEWSVLLDRGLYFIGTCGTDTFRQESLISEDLDVLMTLSPLIHSSLRIPIAATSRVAASLTEKCISIPVDAVQWADGSRVQIFAVVPSNLASGHPNNAKMVGAVKQGFSMMCKAEYKEALGPFGVAIRAAEEAQSRPLDAVSGGALEIAVHRTASRLLDISAVLQTSNSVYSRQYIGWPTPSGPSIASAISPVFDHTRAVARNERLEANLQELARIKESNLPKFGSRTTAGSAEASALFEMAFTQDQTYTGSGPLSATSIGTAGSGSEGLSGTELPSGMMLESVTASDMLPTPGTSVHGMSITTTYLNRWRRSASRLGRGTFGDVYRALHENGSIAAMKIVPLAKQTTDIDELRKELLVTASQRHENLVGFVDAEVTPNEMVVVMELMAGGSLEALQSDFGELPMPVVRRFVIDILRGLSHLHRADIIHCDIKPQNVLVGVDGICKLADFGSAMHPQMAAERNHGDEDQPQMRGTPAFMSPEVAGGAPPSKASDIWSLGILVHELLTGDRPFNAKQKQTMKIGGIACIRALSQIKEDVTDDQDVRFPPKPRVNDAMPMADPIRRFVAACLQMNPSKRPSCEELLSQEMLL